MKSPVTRVLAGALALAAVATAAHATNPIITDQFSADPSARVFDGRVYLYPSHDIIATEGKGRPGWFCMEDYHVFSSADLTDWTDHGVILGQTTVPWAKHDAYAFWAPDCVEKDGKYYFYFPAPPDKSEVRGFNIGVAISDNPAGPFTPEAAPIAGVRGIDPSVFIDKDGTAWLYYAARDIFVAKLKPNMVEIDGEPRVIANLPEKGLKEGPFLFERNGIFYLTYPHVENKIERIEYATADNPLGPFTRRGVIMDESESGCWTNQQSFVRFNGEWIIFYHDKDLSPDFDKARSARADRLFFNDDGTIRKVVPTLRGVGVVDAASDIQVDRYSATSGDDVAVSFLDPADTFSGWKTTLMKPGAWVRFDEVDFRRIGLKKIVARVRAETGGRVEVRRDSVDGPLLGSIDVRAGADWDSAMSRATNIQVGLHDIFVISTGGHAVEIDWIRFE